MGAEVRGGSVTVEVADGIALVALDRPQKRNALDDATVLALGELFADPPAGARVAVLHASGEHFSAGLDLGELREADTFTGVAHSRMWHRCFDSIELGSIPVVSVLKGAVVGGGLELAAATHLRVAERSTYYALPEGSHGLFLGGGGSVRLPRLIGVSRMTDLMLTGRRYDAEEGQRLGLSHYLCDDGAGLDEALRLARRIADVAPVTTFAVLQALPAIGEMDRRHGFLAESLMAAIAQGTDDAKQRMARFLDGRRDAEPAG
jgi:enoyl-CoA hydratase/carnithine racemase